MAELKQRLEEAEVERDKLLEELKGVHGIGASDSEDMDEMLDFPGMRPGCICTSPILGTEHAYTSMHVSLLCHLGLPASVVSGSRLIDFCFAHS